MKRMSYLFIVLLNFCFVHVSFAGLIIDITEGSEGALPIAVAPFNSTALGNQNVVDIASVIRDDLRRCGLFNPLAPNELPDKPDAMSQIDFMRWKGSGLENLVVGNIYPANGGEYQIVFKMYDIYTGQVSASGKIDSNQRKLRSAAHKISDVIYEKLTGNRGDFDTRISYVVADKDARGKIRYSLKVAEADGYNEQNVLTSAQPIMSPDWSPNGRRLAYVSFENHRSNVFIQELKTGKRMRVSKYRGINSAPRWAPDGKRLALSLSKDGNAEIYVLYIDSGVLQRITRHYAIDTEPSWSPDGKQLLFTSDRGGKPQIYRIDIDASGRAGKPNRITFEGKYNARPNYSPDGTQMTFITQVGHDFRVALMDLISGDTRILTESSLDESASFSPNGLSIIYATQTLGKGVLEVKPINADIPPYRVRGINGDIREPSWEDFH